MDCVPWNRAPWTAIVPSKTQPRLNRNADSLGATVHASWFGGWVFLFGPTVSQ